MTDDKIILSYPCPKSQFNPDTMTDLARQRLGREFRARVPARERRHWEKTIERWVQDDQGNMVMKQVWERIP